MNFGLKLWSTNLQNIEQAQQLYQEKEFNYIELFVVPQSEKNVSIWKSLQIPIILHAPHSYSGLNFSIPEHIDTNKILIDLVNIYFNELNPKYVIFHPGISGTLSETIRQINLFKKQYPVLFNYSLIENKPKLGLNLENCIGSSPEEIDTIIKELRLGFCLDFGHAICSAAALKIDWKEIINSFLQLFPQMFHLSDGHIESLKDEHLHIGNGNFEIPWILSKIDSKSLISLETKRDNPLLLDDFLQDIETLKRKCI